MIQLRLFDRTNRLRGFAHFWGKYVCGFDPSVHCINCLIGTRSALVNPAMHCDATPIDMTEAAAFDYLYLCGVSRDWRTNFHLVLRPLAGATATAVTFTGTIVDATNAEAVPIPWLPEDYKGRGQAFTTCRNWQFGESAYGAASRSSSSAAE